ncbi:MAG: PE domain-containing protein [Mycobacterium sp.]|jgi:hypothetical protein|nr:PE domain-containing protein [Mycobacterium sp.]
MILNVGAASIATSAVTETAIGTEIAAVTSAAAVAITGVMPMGADLDSIAFAAALNAAGASYLGAAGEHVANRTLFASAQDLAAATYTVTDVISNASLAL